MTLCWHKYKLDKPHDKWRIGDGINTMFRYKCIKCSKVNYFGHLPGEKRIDLFNRFVK